MPSVPLCQSVPDGEIMPKRLYPCRFDTPIDIGRLQRFVTDFEQQLGWKFINPVLKRSAKSPLLAGSCRIAGQCDTDKPGL